jgi:hypothetical protein
VNWIQAPRMQVVWEVLEAARESGEKPVSVRLIDAAKRGSRKQAEDWRAVKAFRVE